MLKQNDRLGRYTVIRLLAQGGFGVVYLATDPKLDLQVAIKTLHPWLAQDPDNGQEYVKRFQREARALARLTHPNIARVFDVDYDPAHDLHYLSMEYLPGGALSKYIPSSGLSELQAADIVRQILSALQNAHAHGILHRDLKPSNVLKAEDGRWVLADFGLAQMANNATLMTGQFSRGAGTAAYMSPEQINGAPLDARSDLYSQGAMWFELLSGRPPFKSDSAPHLLMQHLNEPPPDLRNLKPEVSAPTRNIINKLLAKKPAERPSSATETLALLDAASHKAVLPAPKPSHKWTVIAPLAFLLLVSLGGMALAQAAATRNDTPKVVLAISTATSLPTAQITLTAPPTSPPASAAPAAISEAATTSASLQATKTTPNKPTPTLDPGLPTPKPTSAPSNQPTEKAKSVPPSGSFSTPSILGPANGQNVGGDDGPVLKWTSVGALAANQYYRVSIRYGPGWDVMCLKDTQAMPNAYVRDVGAQNDTFNWNVDVVSATGAPNANRSCTGTVQALSGASTSTFVWNKPSNGGSGSSQPSCPPGQIFDPITGKCV